MGNLNCISNCELGENTQSKAPKLRVSTAPVCNIEGCFMLELTKINVNSDFFDNMPIDDKSGELLLHHGGPLHRL